MGKFGLLIVGQMLLLITCCLCVRIRCDDDNNSTLCVEEERLALLTFKHSFEGPYVQPLGSWQGHDCCGWDGVTCDKSTGHVLKLDIRAPPLYYPVVANEVNPSLMKLKYLKYLDLSGNDFHGSTIPQFLGQMKGLTYLNLSYASLYGKVPHHLGNLTNLEFLDLGGFPNGLYVDDFKWVSSLSSVQHLDFWGVSLSHVFPPNLVEQVLTQLPSLVYLDLSDCGLNHTHLFTHPSSNSTFLPPTLHYLDLSYNSFSGPIPASLQNITSLEFLDFSDNLLNSSIPLWLGNLKNLKFLHLESSELNNLDGGMELVLRNLSNLQSLYLHRNQFGGPIPSSLWRLSFLTDLVLSHNKLNETISTSLGQLSNLMVLDLSNNQLHGMIPESLGQLVNLRWLHLYSNALEGVISSEYHLANLSSLKSILLHENHLITLWIEPNWIPPFQLTNIDFSSCKFEPGQFPTWLRTQNQLEALKLSNTSISDTFPLFLLEDKPFLVSLDLSHNQIKGHLPYHLGNGTKSLYSVNMKDNMLNGSIPNWFCNQKSVEMLDLSKNRFSGGMPSCWNNQQDLMVLDLSFNKLSGIIPSSFKNMSSLQWLTLSNNNLTGPIPLGLSYVISHLSVLDLGGNRLSGNIPTWIGKGGFPYLQILKLRDNMFNGTIPSQLCLLYFLQIMDLANNDLEGKLPTCLGNLPAMRYFIPYLTPDIYGEWNKSNIRQVLKGREFEYTTVLTFVVNMDLSGNRLVGSIPQELTHLSDLVGLNLSRNQFSGHIPKEIGDLRSLESLDLSHNQLSGEIPYTLSALTSLSYLNLSSNNLVGKIPQGNQLQTLDDPSIYEDNPHLCGPPLPQACPENNPTGNGLGEDKGIDLEKMWFCIVVIAGYATGFWTVVGVLLAKKRWRDTYFTYVDEIKDNIYVAVAVKMGAVKKKMKKMEAGQPQFKTRRLVSDVFFKLAVEDGMNLKLAIDWFLLLPLSFFLLYSYIGKEQQATSHQDGIYVTSLPNPCLSFLSLRSASLVSLTNQLLKPKIKLDLPSLKLNSDQVNIRCNPTTSDDETQKKGTRL